MLYPQQQGFQPAPGYQATLVYQQSPPFYAPPFFGQARGSYQEMPSAPSFQAPVAAPAPSTAPAKNKRKKKKNVAPAVLSFVPPQVSLAQPPFLLDAARSSGMGNSMGAVPVAQSVPSVQPSGVTESTELPLVKPEKCWKCSVDTHATKDCKVQH
jgi:hypothetical protein